MNDYIYGMLRFMYDETCNLAAFYDVQLENMEDFARWNLPDEIGLGWIDARDTKRIKTLQESGVISYDVAEMLNQIVQRFEDAFDLPEAERDKVYSHEAMQGSAFWDTQRQAAQTLAPILKRAMDSMQE